MELQAGRSSGTPSLAHWTVAIPPSIAVAFPFMDMFIRFTVTPLNQSKSIFFLGRPLKSWASAVPFVDKPIGGSLGQHPEHQHSEVVSYPTVDGLAPYVPRFQQSSLLACPFLWAWSGTLASQHSGLSSPMQFINAASF